MALSEEQKKRIEEEEYRKVARQRAIKDTQISAKLDAKVQMDKNVRSDNYGAVRELYRDVKSIIRKGIMGIWLVLTAMYGAALTACLWGIPAPALSFPLGWCSTGVLYLLWGHTFQPKRSWDLNSGTPWDQSPTWFAVLIGFLAIGLFLSVLYLIWRRYSWPLSKRLWIHVWRLNQPVIRFAKWHQQ